MNSELLRNRLMSVAVRHGPRRTSISRRRSWATVATRLRTACSAGSSRTGLPSRRSTVSCTSSAMVLGEFGRMPSRPTVATRHSCCSLASPSTASRMRAAAASGSRRSSAPPAAAGRSAAPARVRRRASSSSSRAPLVPGPQRLEHLSQRCPVERVVQPRGDGHVVERAVLREPAQEVEPAPRVRHGRECGARCGYDPRPLRLAAEALAPRREVRQGRGPQEDPQEDPQGGVQAERSP
ncbi:hypothetical protein SALBM311S_02571 [Streptomyces alboniger]